MDEREKECQHECFHKRIRILGSEATGWCTCLDCRETFPLYVGINLMIARFEQILERLEEKADGG